jgi:hypothetical protein
MKPTSVRGDVIQLTMYGCRAVKWMAERSPQVFSGLKWTTDPTQACNYPMTFRCNKPNLTRYLHYTVHRVCVDTPSYRLLVLGSPPTSPPR